MAERVGFEPTSPVLPGYPLSRRALSTAQTPLQTCKFNGHRRFQQSAHTWIITSPAQREERLQSSAAFGRQNAARHLDTMVKRRMIEDRKTRMRRPALGIVGGVNQWGAP